MDLSRLGFATAVLHAAVPARRCPVNAMGLLASCRVAWEQGARLVALWGSDDRDRERGYTIHAVVQDAEGLVMFELTLPTGDSTYPDLSVVFPAANRMQRATFDLLGLASEGDDQRPWVWQASWPIDQFPLRRDFEALAKWQPGQEEYAFVRVEGDGVHEIPVGPVHAGIIEPGHFRFQVVGEKVLRLEERLGYVHKGIEKRFEGMSAATGHRLAGRVSGDSTVAYAWAYAQALEAITGVTPPARAAWLRALVLERERIANHLGDLGYLGNDGGFAFGLAQFSRLKEDRAPHELHAVRSPLRDGLDRPGRRRARPGAGQAPRRSATNARRSSAKCACCSDIYDEHAGLQDRFLHLRRLTPELAATLGVIGLAGRASGQACTICAAISRRCPTIALGVRKAGGEAGDVAARVTRALRRDLRIAAPRAHDRRRASPEGDIAVALPAPHRPQGPRAGSRAGAASPGRAGMRARRRDPPLPSRTIRRGRTGPRSSTR